jgi:hypothetical protein
LTPLGSFILGTIQFLSGTAKTLKGLKGLIDKLIFKKGAGAKAAGVAKLALAAGTLFALKEATDYDKEKRQYKTLSNEELLKQKTRLSKSLEEPRQFYQGEGMDRTNTKRSLGFIEEEVKSRGLSSEKFSTGGQIFSGLVTEKDGVKVSGAGKDTQAFPVMGGGTAVLQPEEFVLNKGGVKNLLALGIDPLKLNTGPNANKPANITTGIKAMSTGGVVGGDNQKILSASRKIIGEGKGVINQCAITTRKALTLAGNPVGGKTTSIGDLDVPKGPSKFTTGEGYAASLAGSDLGKVIKNKPEIKGGDLIFWRADRDKGGEVNKGAITHVGVAADDGLKNQFDHTISKGWHYRPHWHSADGTSWFAGIRLNSEKPNDQKQTPKAPKLPSPSIGQMMFRPAGGEKYGGDPRNQNIQKQTPTPSIGQMMFRPAGGEKYGGDPRGDSDNLITNHSGIKLPYSQDNILMRAERGEYVVPSAAVKKYGVSNLDKISSLDPNFKNNSLEIPRPIPKSNLSRDPIMLPPITQGQNMIGSSASGSGTQIPSFGAICPSSSAGATRKILCDTYGIIA